MSLTPLFRMLFVSAILLLVSQSDVLAQPVPPSTGGNKVCNPMAHQRFSKLLDRCVVLEQEGIKLKSQVIGYAPNAFVIEDQATDEELNSPNYVNRAEVFLSKNGVITSILLTRTEDPNYASWENGPYLLYMEADDNDNSVYRLEKTVGNRAVLIYAQ